jgi:hypothetical protein
MGVTMCGAMIVTVRSVLMIVVFVGILFMRMIMLRGSPAFVRVVSMGIVVT